MIMCLHIKHINLPSRKKKYCPTSAGFPPGEVPKELPVDAPVESDLWHSLRSYLGTWPMKGCKAKSSNLLMFFCRSRVPSFLEGLSFGSFSDKQLAVLSVSTECDHSAAWRSFACSLGRGASIHSTKRRTKYR